MNTIKYRVDEEVFLDLLKYFSKPENNLEFIKLATGYLNLQKEFEEVLNSNKNLITDIITSSPRANGFYKGGMFKKYIPGMYRVKARNLLRKN